MPVSVSKVLETAVLKCKVGGPHKTVWLVTTFFTLSVGLQFADGEIGTG